MNVEKPSAEDAPSTIAVLVDIINRGIFDILEHIQPGKGGEIQLTDCKCSLRERSCMPITSKVEDMM